MSWYLLLSQTLLALLLLSLCVLFNVLDGHMHSIGQKPCSHSILEKSLTHFVTYSLVPKTANAVRNGRSLARQRRSLANSPAEVACNGLLACRLPFCVQNITLPAKISAQALFQTCSCRVSEVE
eukprot:gnl/TRDRNA2_/TRDRNA2_202761_c0_seq1.p1 gnl/TRDRNA2_/TRDRNA2_202761_c0~~gnl/TRDRNA2_/TRDRNA2_202761_c0_seq1.p1  ORF type:complete len:124 (-),score=1.86 gnl/TRDRNA2_/TRDRNA2_202761_c0_seq1:83-454(-)